jgi:hypothetical protein
MGLRITEAAYSFLDCGCRAATRSISSAWDKASFARSVMSSIWAAVLIPPSHAVSADANNRAARFLNLSEASMGRQHTVAAMGALFKRKHKSVGVKTKTNTIKIRQ